MPHAIENDRPRVTATTSRSIGNKKKEKEGSAVQTQRTTADEAPAAEPTVMPLSSGGSTTATTSDVPSVRRLTEDEYLAKVTGGAPSSTSQRRKRPRNEGESDDNNNNNVEVEGDEAEGKRMTTTTGVVNGLLNSELLATDAIYRILHSTHRSDVIEFTKCVLGDTECSRLAQYLQDEYTHSGLRSLKLQLGVEMSRGFHRMLPALTLHRTTIRRLDLSRNRLNADDVLTLCRALGLSSSSPSSLLGASGASSSTGTPAVLSSLELLDLSWNRKIGNAGAQLLLHTLRDNAVIRAVILKSISIDDEGAKQIAPLLWSRPFPQTRQEQERRAIGSKGSAEESLLDHFPMSHRSSFDFFLNLNENCIGAVGVMALRRELPGHVSLTVVQQHVRRVKPSQAQVAPADELKE